MVKEVNKYDLLCFLIESTKQLQVKEDNDVPNICRQVIKWSTIIEIKKKEKNLNLQYFCWLLSDQTKIFK